MAVKPLVYYPSPVLTSKTQPVEEFNDELRALIQDMWDTMYEARGVGLAANQIGVAKQVAVIDTSKDKTEHIILVNPKILEKDNLVKMEEGCLSVPGAWDSVKRYQFVKFEAQDSYGKSYTMEAYDLLAEAVQHEIDHLNGTVFIDHLSSLKKARAKKKLDKFKRSNGIK